MGIEEILSTLGQKGWAETEGQNNIWIEGSENVKNDLNKALEATEESLMNEAIRRAKISVTKKAPINK